jgi:hypothetical protein
MNLKIGQKVKLKRFNGTLRPDENCPSYENYWQLIGSIGQIVKDPNEKDQYASFSDNPRLLVQFEKDVKSLGLECHNNVENSLWILESDLKKL